MMLTHFYPLKPRNRKTTGKTTRNTIRHMWWLFLGCFSTGNTILQSSCLPTMRQAGFFIANFNWWKIRL